MFNVKCDRVIELVDGISAEVALLRGSALPASWTGWPRLPPFGTGAWLSVVGTAPPPIVLGGKFGGAALHWRALPSSIAPGYDRALQDQCRSSSPHPEAAASSDELAGIR